MNFLKAEWRKLAFANYIVDKELLTEYVPFGTELDLWDDQCFISIVCLKFSNTRLLGIKVPMHVNFEEVNLRFYVKRFEDGKWKRAAVFIKEIVPKRAITFVAKTIYNESYETMKMSHKFYETENNRTVEYYWSKAGIEHFFKIQASLVDFEITSNSEAEFITEHYWGYARVTDSKTNEYRVSHPRWKMYEIENYELKLDFGILYGEKFAFLNKVKPNSIMLAEGSETTVASKRVIKFSPSPL